MVHMRPRRTTCKSVLQRVQLKFLNWERALLHFEVSNGADVFARAPRQYFYRKIIVKLFFFSFVVVVSVRFFLRGSKFTIFHFEQYFNVAYIPHIVYAYIEVYNKLHHNFETQSYESEPSVNNQEEQYTKNKNKC